MTIQRGSEFIDGVALEEYADEQDDYAQEREIEACIKAVDVDCDGKIGKSLPPSCHVVSCHPVVTASSHHIAWNSVLRRMRNPGIMFRVHCAHVGAG